MLSRTFLPAWVLPAPRHPGKDQEAGTKGPVLVAAFGGGWRAPLAGGILRPEVICPGAPSPTLAGVPSVSSFFSASGSFASLLPASMGLRGPQALVWETSSIRLLGHICQRCPVPYPPPACVEEAVPRWVLIVTELQFLTVTDSPLPGIGGAWLGNWRRGTSSGPQGHL